jgi:hypothetical protein
MASAAYTADQEKFDLGIGQSISQLHESGQQILQWRGALTPALPRYLLIGSARPNCCLYTENENVITADDQQIAQFFTVPLSAGFLIDKRV